MNKTKIDWAHYSWNPIKGICPVGCWYCYARKIYQRFKRDPELSWDGRTPILSHLNPSRIFVCSTMELFHPQIPEIWRDRIFKIIEAPFNKKHTFIILTKMPENIDRPMPPNVWLGVTITGVSDYHRKESLLYDGIKATVKFVSLEPMLRYLPPAVCLGFDWAIMGRLTGHGHYRDPSRIDIADIVRECKKNRIPVFMKNNLKEIWQAPLIQQFPRKMKDAKKEND